MLSPQYTILYVADPAASARLYAGLLGAEAMEVMPTFSLFALENGRMLGLWARDSVRPDGDLKGSANELAFRVTDTAQVDSLHADWHARGLAILQAPVTLDFGYTFTAADPDGHRLRVFARSE